MTTLTSLAGNSLNAVTATGPGTVFNLGIPKTAVSMYVTVTGSPTSYNINLELSIDGINFFTVNAGSVSNTSAFPYTCGWVGGQGSGNANSLLIPSITAVRANLTAFSGGTSPTFTAFIAAA